MRVLGRIKRHPWGVAIGAAATLAGMAVWFAGALDGVDRVGLDLHFRHFGSIEANPAIVLIDVNDHAIPAIGDWPWPRRRHAELVSTLSELGADAIVLDIVFSEPKAPRRPNAALGTHYDVDPTATIYGDAADDLNIYDDAELAEAIRRAGNVYLAMFSFLSPPSVRPEAAIERALDLVDANPELAFDAFEAGVDISHPWTTVRLFNLARMTCRLEGDFSLSTGTLADVVGAKAANELIVAAKRLAAGRLARQYLRDQPGTDFQSFFESVLPKALPDSRSRDRKDLVKAYRVAMALPSVLRHAPVVAPAMASHLPHAYNLTIPSDRFAHLAAGVGFATFEREGQDGVVRSIPMLAAVEGRSLIQLGMLVALDRLGFDHASLRFEEGQLRVGKGAKTRQLDMDAKGLTLVNWHNPPHRNQWQESFDHVPVSRLLEIAENRNAQAENDRYGGLALGRLVAARHADTPAAYADYERLIRQRRKLRASLSQAKENQRRTTLNSDLGDADRAIHVAEEEAIRWLHRTWRLWEKETPRDAEEQEQRDRVEALFSQFGHGELAERLAGINERLSVRTQRLLEELRPRISGKICIVGYTAATVADMIPTPVYAAMPGAMAHANIINMMLENRMAHRAPWWVNLILMVLLCMIVTLITSTRGPLPSFAALVTLIAGLLTLGGLVFGNAGYHLASLPAAALMIGAWASVTIYRQATEERTRRHMQRALAQYTSPAVAAKMAIRSDPKDLEPRATQVACFFSDLQDFTRLSESLGAERTKTVLNPYLVAVSRALIDHGAIVNKFMGDGVFAFFNAPILPCADRMQAACASAIAARRALDDLNQRAGNGGTVPGLVMRIGLSAGEAFVGDYGSGAKLDYTCIGDVVNVGARLERANKRLGTHILVDDAVRTATDETLLFRGVGLLEVAGRAKPVRAHELIGWTADAGNSVQHHIARFEEAISFFQSRSWDACAAALNDCTHSMPEDPVVAHYLHQLDRFRSTHPPTTWSGAIPSSPT